MSNFKNKKALKYIITALAAILAVYLFLGRLMIFYFSAAYNINISYKSLKETASKEILFDGLNISDNKSGVGIFSRHAEFRPGWGRDRGIALDFNIYDASFTKKTPGGGLAYDNLSKLAAVAFNSQWTYKEIYGKMQILKDGIAIRGLMATSDDIRFSFTGIIYNNNTIDADIVVYFSDKFTSDIPPDIVSAVLQDEANGWKSFHVSLSGNYKNPSLQIAGKLFRLNIGLVEKEL